MPCHQVTKTQGFTNCFVNLSVIVPSWPKSTTNPKPNCISYFDNFPKAQGRKEMKGNSCTCANEFIIATD